MREAETMTANNNTRKQQDTRRENVSTSSFLEVAGDVTIKTDATFSSTIRDMLHDAADRGLEPNMPVIDEQQEPPYNTSDDGFTETCASCLTRANSREKATHFCPGCDRRGRYMCSKCLKDHTLWCKGPEHEVQSLSVDRHSDPEYRYNTIKQSEEAPPNKSRALPVPPENEYVNSWLHKNSNSNGSTTERSEDTSELQREHGPDITEHDIASSHGLSLSDNPTLNDDIPTVNHRAMPGRCISPVSDVTYDDVYSRQETTSHIYTDPITMLPLPAMPNPHQRALREPRSWDGMSTSTGHRLNTVYNNHTTPDWRAELTRERRYRSMDVLYKKKKKCVIQ